ncbi:hypothetical protein AGMMS49925_09510 [Deltaproteobacteria bacterium]|nr:hypothetical protein AGMMS49925_09510 [Deltaproteobacteria bacterium]
MNLDDSSTYATDYATELTEELSFIWNASRPETFTHNEIAGDISGIFSWGKMQQSDLNQLRRGMTRVIIQPAYCQTQAVRTFFAYFPV